MTIAEINRRIRREEPAVGLVRGEGYHYYTFDLVITCANRYDGRDDRVYFDTQSVYTPYTSERKASEWIADGIAFGKRIRTEKGLTQPEELPK